MIRKDSRVSHQPASAVLLGVAVCIAAATFKKYL